MPKCYHCAEEVAQPFKCSGCGQNYCHLHQDPIIHNCSIVKEESSHSPYQATRPAYTNVSQASPTQPQYATTGYQPQVTQGVARGTTDGTYTWYRQETLIPEDAFSPDSGIDFKGILFPYQSEFMHLLIGSGLIFVIGLIAFYSELLISYGYGWAIFMLAGFYMTAFLFHEFGHRQVAKHFGFPTKFRLLTFGMGLTAFSVVMGIATMGSDIPAPTLALPGAVVVLGLDKISKETGLCKAAGPIVNLVYGILLLLISFVIPNTMYPLNFFIGSAASLNFMLGSFNMIPIGILDGQNIFKWSKVMYFTLVTALLTLLIFNYIIIYDPNLQLVIYAP